jgi:Uma2 family endonuclease
MGTLQHARLVTFAEFENLPDPPEGHVELHHGQVVLMPPRKIPHAIVQENLSDLLKPLAHRKGWVATEFPFRPRPEYESWQADLAFATNGRLKSTDDYLSGAPDLVIEVLSPSNTKAEIRDRQEICLSNGCKAFWTVNPKLQQVSVTGTDRQKIIYDVPCPSRSHHLSAGRFPSPRFLKSLSKSSRADSLAFRISLYRLKHSLPEHNYRFPYQNQSGY